MFLRTCKMQLWPPCRNYLDKTLQTFCWNSENDEKLIRFPWNLLVNLFIWTCTMKFRQACRENLGKNTKNTPKIHKRWIYILSNKIVFFLIKIDSLATENTILTTLAKTFLWESTDLQLRFRKPEKNYEFFERKITFLKKCLCTCKMQLWQPCRKNLVKTLKTICSNSANDEKIVRFPNEFFSPQ